MPFRTLDRRVGYMNEDPPESEPNDQAARLVTGFEFHGAGWLWETDRDNKLTYLSDKIAGQLDSSYHPVLGRTLSEIFKIVNVSDRVEQQLAVLFGTRAAFDDLVVQLNGTVSDHRWLLAGHPSFDRYGRFSGFVGSGADLTDDRQSAAEIVRLARYDSLTGLANRAYMASTLGDALERSRTTYRPMALLLLDLDRFKVVNDTMGHQSGDRLLQQVAERLCRCIGEQGMVGRLGGDEFLVILPGWSHRKQLSELCLTIIDALSRPYSVNDAAFSIGCSIGVAIAPEHGEEADVIIRNADLALYDAKAGGRGVHQFYHEELLNQANKRRLLEDNLRFALAKDQLHLVYQPIVSTTDAEVIGYEALLRWNHPTLGAISPAEFIPIAEDAGFIDELGKWALRTACETAVQWPAPIRIAVNVSAVQFARQSLPAIVATALANSGLDPARLELEITESVFVEETLETDRMFQSLKSLGVRLVLDDFGTGYSSLSYLRTAPFDKIKIDQSFVRGATKLGNRSPAIIKAIVTLAQTLDMETTAEGVEAEEEVYLIRELGCSHIQGFVYGKPRTREELAEQLAKRQLIEPVALKPARPTRATTLRATTIRTEKKFRSARIRNISADGVMIDHFDGVELAVATKVEIEIEGKILSATVRWVGGGRAGLQFDKSWSF